MAMACPNLEVLKLCPLSRWPLSFGPPKVTLTGLALLMAGCERLHTLHFDTAHLHTTCERVLHVRVGSGAHADGIRVSARGESCRFSLCLSSDLG